MTILPGLASLAGLSLFLSWLLRRSSALMPIVAVSLGMLFFMLAGCLGVLWAGGIAWYALCAAALIFVVLREGKNILALFTPGFVFFIVMGIFFAVLYGITQPMLTQWDEFTFWGTAGKVTSVQNQLYTTADSSLIATSYPPGLIVFSYMMQFFFPFSEAGFIASFAVVYMACFAAAAAMWGKNKTASAVFCAALFLLPFLFEQPLSGQMSLAYLGCMADVPMAAFFGGALCFYFASGEKGGRMLVPFAIVLAALTAIKDMAFALACIALFAAAMDMLFCERDRMALFGLRRTKAMLAGWGMCLAAIAASYLVWWLHLRLSAGINRLDFGSGGTSLDPVTMLVQGVLQLLGINRTAKFQMVLNEMLRAFFERPVMLLGSGAVALCLILAISLAAWVLAPTKRRRRRVLVFTLAMAVGFAGFYIFNIFTYTFIFKGPEAEVLKDYSRYIAPIWMGWLMGALVLLSAAANNRAGSFKRLSAARLANMAVCAALSCAVLVFANKNANFLSVSPSIYSERENIRAVADIARAEGLKPGDRVYIISQRDDATRFYQFGFELEAVRVPVFAGAETDGEGNPVLADGKPVYRGNASSTLVPTPNPDPPTVYDAPCTPEEFTAYLAQENCTHVLVDVPDWYILRDFAHLFSDGLNGWTDDEALGRGHRYYTVEWDGDECLLVAAQAPAATLEIPPGGAP